MTKVSNQHKSKSNPKVKVSLSDYLNFQERYWSSCVHIFSAASEASEHFEEVK
jgi:hypothetical protein